FACPTLACSFSDQSSDPDGSVTSWQWTFGDGTTGSTAQNPSHTYSAAGSYPVTLTVKDNQNASSSPVSHTVQVTAPNQPPTAAFTVSCNGLACSFSDQSSDPDGSVTSWQWTFGDDGPEPVAHLQRGGLLPRHPHRQGQSERELESGLAHGAGDRPEPAAHRRVHGQLQRARLQLQRPEQRSRRLGHELAVDLRRRDLGVDGPEPVAHLQRGRDR